MNIVIILKYRGSNRKRKKKRS